MVIRRFVAGVVAGVLCLCAGASADQVTLTPLKDNTLYQSASGSLSNGLGHGLFVGRTNTGQIRRAVIAFDLGPVPAGSTVTAVSLTLTETRLRGGGGVTLHRLLANWGQGTSDAGGEEGGGTFATPNSATWLHRFYPTETWASAGGDFAAGASASATVGSLGAYTWSAAGMVTDVQAWVNAPEGNFGWLVRGDESRFPTSLRFESREGPVGQRPRLVVTYTPPPGTGACCVAGGACVRATPGACADRGGTHQGADTLCSPNPCPQTSTACCFPDGACRTLTGDACTTQGGSAQAGVCEPNPCPVQTWACCQPNGSCQTLTAAACAAQNGAFQDGVACAPDLCPVVLVPFVDPLPAIPLAVPSSGTQGGAAHYTIRAQRFTQKLHRDLPPTTLYGYGARFPGPTILATVGQPVTIRWQNELRDPLGVALTQHDLAVDTCLLGPDTGGAVPRIVTHLHGGRVDPGSDGRADEGVAPGFSSGVYLYPNQQRAATLWYHDHALGLSRLNVQMGLAGLYLLRDPADAGLNLPAGEFDFPLVLQDRSFNADGSFRYPRSWRDNFFGDYILVNGRVAPFTVVKKGKYRFRLLNASGSRVYTLGFSNGMSFQQIATDGGLLPGPVTTTSVTIAPGERAEIVADFSSLANGSDVLLVNSAPAPYPGEPGVGVVRNVVRFSFVDVPGFTGAVPASLRPVTPVPAAEAKRSRDLVLAKLTEVPCTGERWAVNSLGWHEITETPRKGETEIWSFVNRSGFSHPVHVHLVQFQILDRRPFELVDGAVVPTGTATPPGAGEAGWKDTVRVDPFEIVRVIARFDGATGVYEYHSQTLEEADHAMLRRFRVICPADYDASGAIDVADIFAFLGAWFAQEPAADFNGGGIDVADIFAFLSAWFAGAC